MSDGTTTTERHELIVGKFDPYSDEVAITRDGIVLAHVYGNDGGTVKALALDFVLGRERAQKAEAENARLRERVAELDVMLGQACEAVNWLLDQDWPKDMDPGPGIRTDLAKWLAALAQAGEGGAA